MSELTFLKNFRRKHIDDEDLLSEVPLDQHIKKHDQIYVTFNRVSDLKLVKETEIQSEFDTEESSAEPVNIRWFDLDNQHYCQRFSNAVALVLIALFFVAGISAIEVLDLENNSEVDFSYLLPLFLVICFEIMLFLVGSIMNRMMYPDQQKFADN